MTGSETSVEGKSLRESAHRNTSVDRWPWTNQSSRRKNRHLIRYGSQPGDRRLLDGLLFKASSVLFPHHIVPRARVGLPLEDGLLVAELVRLVDDGAGAAGGLARRLDVRERAAGSVATGNGREAGKIIYKVSVYIIYPKMSLRV